MSTPADPNISGSADPNKSDTLQGTADQTEHRGAGGENVSEQDYQQAPGTVREDQPADSVAGGPESGEGEHGHSGTFVPTSQTESQTAPGTTPDTDVELGGGKGQGLSPQANEVNERPATTVDPDNPARSSGSNVPKDSEGGTPSTVSTDGSGH
jgi:hypothetical protein